MYRNLSVGVYGPPGSAERATAEHALRERFESTAEAYRVATRSEAGLVAERLERVSRMAKRALVIALAALGAALLALARAFGVW